jgi:hypothetical protein
MGTDFIVRQANGCCPGCAAPIGWTGPTVCPNCGISLAGQEGAELYWIAAELARLDEARGQLVERRDFLVAELIRQRELGALGAQPDLTVPGLPSLVSPGPAAAGPGLEPGSLRPAGARLAARPEMSRRSVANLLLAVGGLLLAIAAAVFTVANWGNIGPAGRGAILLALAVIALAAPWPLSRRGLTATAESFAGIGLALTVADTYLARSLVAGSAGVSLGFAAAAVTILAAAWAAYGSLAPARGPRPAAIALAQLCLPLAVAASTRSGGALALAVLVTAGCDVALAAWAGRHQAPIERRTALAAGVLSWLAGIAMASIGAAFRPAIGESLWLTAAFIAAGLVGLGLAARQVPTSPPAGGPEPVGDSASAEADQSVAAEGQPTAAEAGRSVAVEGQSVAPAGQPASAEAGQPVVVEGQPVAVGQRLAAEGQPVAAIPGTAPDAGGLAQVLSGVLLAIGIALPAAAELPGRFVVGDFALAAAAIMAIGWWLAGRVTGQRAIADARLTAPAGTQVAASADAASASARPALAGPVSRATGRRADLARHVAAGGFGVLGGTGLWVAPAALAGLLDPFANVKQMWTGHAAARSLPGLAVTMMVPAVLALVSAACWRGPTARSGRARPLALAIAALAAGSAPVAFGLYGWAGLAVLTALAVLATGAGVLVADRPLALTASWAGVVLAGCAAAASLTTPGQTITELAVLAVICAVASWRARSGMPAILATSQTVAASAGLACAIPLASYRGTGRAGEQIAAFAVLGVAMAAVAVGTLLRRVRPCHALVLDLAAVPVVALAAVLAARQAGTFSVLASSAALLAATTARLRDGRRRLAALGTASLAAVAALVPQLALLAAATVDPYRQLGNPWTPLSIEGAVPGQPSDLRFAVIVLAICAAAAVVGAWVWRGRAGAAGALAVVLPVTVAPAGLAAGLGTGATVALLLAFALALTGWAAAGRTAAPAGSALAAAWLTLPWALATAPATLTTLGCLTAAYVLCAWLARLRAVRSWSAAAAVLTAGALAGSGAAAGGWPAWLCGVTMLALAGGAQLIAAVLGPVGQVTRVRSVPVPGDGTPGRAATRGAVLSSDLAVEITGWLVATVGLLRGLDQAVHASIAFMVAAALCCGAALRPGRRPLLWTGLALGEVALCLRLVAAGVLAPEPYALPAAVILIGAGWRRSRRAPELGSWLTYGPGLAILLLPSLVAAWSDQGWLRPLLLGLTAACITLAGARARLRAPLLIGALVAITDAGRQLAPAVARLAGAVPHWVPIALLGTLLLGVGATYEARLKDLGKLRNVLRRMR